MFEELTFYTPETMQEGHIGLSEIVTVLSSMVREDTFWKELLGVMKDYCVNKNARYDPLRDVVTRLKNDYIGVLNGESKRYCIEIAKILNESNAELGLKN